MKYLILILLLASCDIPDCHYDNSLTGDYYFKCMGTADSTVVDKDFWKVKHDRCTEFSLSASYRCEDRKRK